MAAYGVEETSPLRLPLPLLRHSSTVFSLTNIVNISLYLSQTCHSLAVVVVLLSTLYKTVLQQQDAGVCGEQR